MAPKKNKDQLVEHNNMYVVLRDKNSRHHIVAHRELTYTKTDNLKIGTSASFSLPGDPEFHFEGTILVSGTFSN
ncbi:unnamed protein product [Rotaria sp. Silwood2]|nr:unnamed protein product [Rotaria sp. Silwood2]